MVHTIQHFRADRLRSFCCQVFESLGVSGEDASITADVLVAADLRGVDSHGVARMKRYVSGIQQGVMKARASPRIVRESSCTATIDGDAGLGQPISSRAMQVAISKAKKHNLGLVAVKNSNHFGIAGYYAMMALAEDMIGVCTTNSEALVVPTFGRNAILGTNPIAIAVPSNKEHPFVLDMATSTVTRGKLEVHARMKKSIPLSWATDENGARTDDPTRVLRNIIGRKGGGLMPLGGSSEESGGHKGYGLAIAVEIFSAILSGASYATRVYPTDEEGKPLPSRIGHSFSAIRIDAFRSRSEFKRDMDDLIRCMHDAPRANGAKRIYIHGEKEFEQCEQRAKHGIPLSANVVEDLCSIAEQLGIDKPL
jgi:L-2-hydroxycarboxylate dehydrogenase (NAD+)